MSQEQSLSFPKIVKDFLSTEYPDCIKDIFGENYGFISTQKLLSEWKAIQVNGKEQEIIQVATQWANLVKQALAKPLSNPKLTKLEIFDRLNLPMLNGQLVYSSNLGIAINRKGEQISEDNTEDWLIISRVSYEIIRILMVEIIWQTKLIESSTSKQIAENTIDSMKNSIRFFASRFNCKIPIPRQATMADWDENRLLGHIIYHVAISMGNKHKAACNIADIPSLLTKRNNG